MALIYDTTMAPTKLELLAGWLPKQSWFAGDVAKLAPVGAYRFDDPVGEVGMEGILLTAGDEVVYHVPLTYRGAPLDDGDAFLLGTSEHGVLGRRWISDAAGDPAYRGALALMICRGGSEAEQTTGLLGDDGRPTGTEEPRKRDTSLQGSGRPGYEVPDFRSATVETVGRLTRIEADLATIDLMRVVDLEEREAADQLSMQARWPGQAQPAILALLYGA